MVALGDARAGKLADNIAGFGRALRRAGVPVDSARIALAQRAALLVGVARRADFAAALECALVSREADRALFRELFDAWFRDPEVAHKLLAQMLPQAQEPARAPRRRPRVAQALAPTRRGDAMPLPPTQRLECDLRLSASDQQRLRQADFNTLDGDEYQLVQRLARDIALPVPQWPLRRRTAGLRGAALHWPRTLRDMARLGGEAAALHRWQRRRAPLPLLVLVDVSGSMERYARLLLAFLHAATRTLRRRDVFAFGTRLTDLGPAFRLADTDAMLAAAGVAICDFAGGTRLAASLAELRGQHARRLVGRRTLVLLISDGLDTGEPAQLDEELGWLRRHCRSLVWLNPLLRWDGYQPLARGAGVLHRHADAMLAVHSLDRLQDLAASLHTLLRLQPARPAARPAGVRPPPSNPIDRS